ncbi:Membrane protein, partial [hydrothermal vent metagenome]
LTEVFTEPPTHKVILDYMLAGFAHIIPQGLDHILFILGIFLLSTRLKPLAWQATMFTLAHSITLSLSMFNIISLPASIVEPLIALSIAYIGLENIFAHKLNTSRLALVFAFGLLHGLGFASVLADFGMPQHAYASALIGFNLGVEVGQLAILSGAYFAITIWFKNKQHFHNYITVPGSIFIAMTGLYWAWDRFSWTAL